MQVEKRPLALCTNVIFYFYGHYACAYCMFILQGQTVKINRQISTKFFSVVFVLLSFIFRPLHCNTYTDSDYPFTNIHTFRIDNDRTSVILLVLKVFCLSHSFFYSSRFVSFAVYE